MARSVEESKNGRNSGRLKLLKWYTHRDLNPKPSGP